MCEGNCNPMTGTQELMARIAESITLPVMLVTVLGAVYGGILYYRPAPSQRLDANEQDIRIVEGMVYEYINSSGAEISSVRGEMIQLDRWVGSVNQAIIQLKDLSSTNAMILVEMMKEKE